MAHIVEINNPFEPLKETRVSEVKDCVTVREYLRRSKTVFKRPTICIVDGRALLRKEWDKYIIGEDTIVNFVAVQGEVFSAAYYLVFALITVAAVAVALSIPKPTLPGQVPEPDPVYDLKGQRNQNRLGSPIEVPYGRNRLWPSYAARSYVRYINNEQYLFQLFNVGQGDYALDVADMKIEETPLTNFQDVFYEVSGPGEPVTFFPDDVITSVAISGLELLGLNELTYAGISGPFTLNASGTLANRLEIDVVLPLGLFFGGSDGKLQSRTVTALFEYRQIDGAGAPIGGWVELVSFAKTLATNTPQRYTYGVDVTAGRYEVRGVRTNNKDTDANAGNTLIWDAGRAFLESTKVPPDTTRIALKLRASNNLNDRALSRFNCIATRKLPIYDPDTETWSALTETRDIIPAYCDLFRAAYGGKQDDVFLDLPELWDVLHPYFVGLGWKFDWVFEQRSTVWESAKVIARAGRAVPMLNISQVTMVRDIAKSTPTAIFNQENIIEGSFRWDIAFAELDDFDGVEIEYIDPVSFLPATIKCLVDGEAGDNCEQVKFPGCQDPDRAHEEGLYLRRARLRQRESIVFEVELEGRIPKYSALIKVVHDLPKWGQGGLVVSIVGTAVTLSEPADFSAGGTHKIGFRTKTGGTQGPYTVTATADSKVVTLAAPISTSGFIFNDISERPLYYFGPTNLEDTLCLVTGLAPSTRRVEIKAVVYNGTVYDGDGTPAPASDDTPNPPAIPPNPSLACGNVIATQNPLDLSKIKLAWSPALGAYEYHVESSADGETWTDAGRTIGLILDVPMLQGEVIYLRVKAVGSGGSGAWCYPAIGPGSDGNPPQDCDDDYLCLIPIRAPLTLAVSCKERDGTAVLCGASEFVSPSTPPNKYLRRQVTGSMALLDDWTTSSCNASATPVQGRQEGDFPVYVFFNEICHGYVVVTLLSVDVDTGVHHYQLTGADWDNVSPPPPGFYVHRYAGAWGAATPWSPLINGTPRSIGYTFDINPGVTFSAGIAVYSITTGIGAWNYIAGTDEYTDNWNIDEQYSPDDCSLSANHTTTRTRTGAAPVSPIPGRNAGYVAFEAAGRPDEFYLPYFTLIVQMEPYYVSTTVNPTSRVTVGLGCIVGTGFGLASKRAVGTVTEQLSNEDTEDNAIARLLATQPDWADIVWATCSSLPCCETIYGIRTGFDFQYKEAHCQIHATGMVINGFSVVQVNIWSYDYTTGVDRLAQQRSFTTYADTLGGATWEFELPIERGFRHYVKSMQFRSL